MSEGRKMQQRLKAVWAHGSQDAAPRETNWRYVPRSTGGTAWRVFDRRAEEFLGDKELLGLTVERLATEKLRLDA